MGSVHYKNYAIFLIMILASVRGLPTRLLLNSNYFRLRARVHTSILT